MNLGPLPPLASLIGVTNIVMVGCITQQHLGTQLVTLNATPSFDSLTPFPPHPPPFETSNSSSFVIDVRAHDAPCWGPFLLLIYLARTLELINLTFQTWPCELIIDAFLLSSS
jgi:hypothetical protein